MKTHRSSKIVLALVIASAAAVFGTGCIAEPGTEHTGQSDEALRNQNGGDYTPTTYTCTAESWDTTDTFESSLRAMGCTGKALMQSNGNGTGWFSTGCWWTQANVWCPSTGSYQTMNAAGLAQCYANVAPYYAFTNPAGAGQCTPGGIIVGWDPTCGGKGCLTIN